jgi:hypothetical protein
MSEIERVAVVLGVVVDDCPPLDGAERFAQGLVEAMTEWNFDELPDDLRSGLVDWSLRFQRWADANETERYWR